MNTFEFKWKKSNGTPVEKNVMEKLLKSSRGSTAVVI
jgi:hypothetical protein